MASCGASVPYACAFTIRGVRPSPRPFSPLRFCFSRASASWPSRRFVVAKAFRFWSQAPGIVVALLVLAVVVALGTYARLGEPFVQVGDHAVLESHTIHATHVRAFLGPYSRFGWSHPGPLYFYLLAPFYVLSGSQPAGLFAGAVVINMAAFATTAWLTLRLAGCSWALAILAACALYLVRIGDSLASAWNPHVLPLPTMALIVICAAVATGRVWTLPWAVFVGTFLVQTHVAMVPVVGTVAAVALAVGVAPALRAGRSDEVLRVRRAVNVSLWLLAGLWALPLAEQLVRVPGNLGRVLAFFTTEAHAGQPLGLAFAAWADMITGIQPPASEFQWGGGLPPSVNVWSGSLAVVQVSLVTAATLRAVREQRSFEAALGLLLIVASCVSLLAVTRITGELLPYLVFWVSGIGALNAGVILGFVIRGLSNRMPGVPRAAVRALCVVLCGVVGMSALGDLRTGMAHGSRPRAGEVDAKRLWQALEAFTREQGMTKPLLRIDQPTWGIAAGVIVQLQKAGVLFAVEDDWLPMFSAELAATGDEGCVLTFVHRGQLDELLRQPGHLLVGQGGETFLVHGPAAGVPAVGPPR